MNGNRREARNRAVHRPSTNVPALLAILAAAGVGGYFIWKFTGAAASATDADTPLSMPADGVPDHRFHFLSAWETAQVPLATRFDPPLGTDLGRLVYNAQKFRELN